MTKRNIWSGVLFGVGLAAFVDEVLFHQLLRWHHFYDQATTDIGLISDGLLHAFSWFATIGGLFIYADLKRKSSWKASKWWGGVLLGAGGFQLYDGTVQHKIMKIHQIRYVDNVHIYDWVWNILAIIMIVIGFILMKNNIKTRKINESHA
ncbi:DUF2243 domain-containing protein [Alkalihalobacillus trypoxylicola]|uniref:DUF2243 domain-containing protein n=1 Tax=Alkalihalobacillus trypoxylicola TaxID=519424 RepID=A0A161PFK2_9BACI|nr:DUF2243 domain-containing protein [Alkalihalobacillus trypoxylicola]KYG31917.1 hypothetical protein AZF04_03835 [Alkalihalobacillus trypoxylicola]